MFSNNTHGTDLIGQGHYTNDSCTSVVEYRGSTAEEYYNTRGSVVEYTRGSAAGYYNRESVVEYRGSIAEYCNTRGSVVEYRGSVAECYNSREYEGSTGTKDCRKLAREQQAEVMTSNITWYTSTSKETCRVV